MKRKFTDQELYRRQHLQRLQEQNLDPFKITKVERSHSTETFKQQFSDPASHAQSALVTVAGRIMNVRQTFAIIQDNFGKLQIYLPKNNVSEQTFTLWKQLDIGDIVSVSGFPMITKTGEITLKAAEVIIISKSLKVLPEKWHGLEDEEERSRKRYVDLIMSRESFDVFLLRSKIIAKIREFMMNQNYIEVETPILQPILGGAAAKPFTTHHNTLDMPFYLRIAPELYLKRCIIGGMEKVFEIGRLFRNEGMDSTHNPEFTTLEAYTAYEDMEYMVNLAQSLIHFLVNQTNMMPIEFNGQTIDLSKPFKRYDMQDLIKEKIGVDFRIVKNLSQAIDLAKIYSVPLKPHFNSVGHIINAFFEHYCEKECIDPTFITGHPVEVSPLAKRNANEPGITERFELFILGKEYMNAFSELNDPIDQLDRFNQQLELKNLGDEETSEMDIDFIEALEYGMPPCAGIGIGIDRLAMLFANKKTIRDVLLFPHLRTKG